MARPIASFLSTHLYSPLAFSTTAASTLRALSVNPSVRYPGFIVTGTRVPFTCSHEAEEGQGVSGVAKSRTGSQYRPCTQ